MTLATLHRLTFPALAVSFTAEFGLTLPSLGVLQSAVLAGYLVGQVPCGFLADRFGGAKVLLCGLIAWSASLGLTPLARLSSSPVLALGAARAALGLAQSCMMPSISAMAAKCIPDAHRGRAVSFIYACSSSGTVLGLAATPALAGLLGWAATFQAYAAIGICWGLMGLAILPKHPEQHHNPAPRSEHDASVASAPAAKSPLRKQASRQQPGELSESSQPGTLSMMGMLGQVAVLCWTHSAIGWGFFILQSWIPTYLSSLGMADPGTAGLLSALPWVATAAVALIAGNLADWMLTRLHWELPRVRRVMQSIASLGPALALLPLVLVPQRCGVTGSVACLTATLALQAFCYAGFHTYVQDVAPADAGKLLGITNTCGTAVGIVGNLATGRLAASSWGYTAVFGLTAAVYLSAFILWNLTMHGAEIRLS
ncbi:hypothetical protein WJX72_000485 [[Myrmecia] bisecta]|uniref:Major facilitator superfamily (MFS) profile domain-containing protein n=1 Tax=[Myrmecia] bisecta TaxID=41462 RepID=A0AAW1PE71_9CHLO